MGGSKRQVREAVIWGCIGFFSTCPYYGLRSNNIPLAFGMTPDAAATALAAPLERATGRRGAEIYYAELPTAVPSILYSTDRRVWLQFRNGRLTGWTNDWDHHW